MLNEARKREKVANAFLLATLAASAAQSPKDFVRTGHVEAPGTALMQTFGKRRGEAERNLDHGRIVARNVKKKTFKEFVEESYEYIEESSSGESSRRRLSPRGPNSNRWERTKQRSVSSSNAALKKAGFSRSTKYPTGRGGRPSRWTETSVSSHHDTETGTHANQSDYASRHVGKTGPSSKRVLALRRLRRQLGGDRTPRPVHDVRVSKKRTYDDIPASTMTKGRSFRQEVTQGVSTNLKKAGAKPGDIMTATPTSPSRSRMYGRTHNAETDRNTGVLVSRIRKESYLEEARRDTGLRGLKHGLGDSKSDAISKGFRFFRGSDGRIREIRNYGSRSKPGGRVTPYEKETARRSGRNKRLDDVTPPEHQDHMAYARKKSQATRMGMDVHHMTPVAKSAKLKASMSPEQWAQRLKDDEEKGIYHGNHPRNLALTKRQGESGSGVSHHGTIHTKRRQNLTWQELSKKIKQVRQTARKRKLTRQNTEG